MPARSLKPIQAIAIAVALICLQASGIAIFHSRPWVAWGITYTAMFAVPFCLLVICCWRAWKATHLRLQWVLLALSTFLWLVGFAIRTWSIFFDKGGFAEGNPVLENLSSWVYFYGSIPIFIALSLPSGKIYPRLFFSIDAIQYVIAGYLGYLEFYAIRPFSNVPSEFAHYLNFINDFYILVALAIAIAATLRFFASATSDERNFYRTFCLCQWITLSLDFSFSLTPLNNNAANSGLATTAESLITCILFFYTPDESKDEVSANTGNALTIFLNTASPAFLTLALLVLAINTARHSFLLGASAVLAAFLLFGLRATVLQSRYEQSQQSLRDARDKLEDLSLRDALTGVANRRCFDRVLESEWNRATREHNPLSLLLIDIDYFKNLNDRYGHKVGDDCLVRIAVALQTTLPRSGDLLARYGGEEFAAILPGTGQPGAQTVASKMQDAVDALRIVNETKIGNYVTLSIGVATYQFPHVGSPGLLVEASDKALYRAKAGGRNRIELAVAPFSSNVLTASG